MASENSFDGFVKRLGFEKFPFSQFSTENELHIRDKLFYSPSDYSQILEAFSSGQSMFVLGNRGSGKTAMLYDFESKVEKSTCLIAWLDDFTILNSPFTSCDFYNMLIQKITDKVFEQLVNQRDRIDNIKPEQKMLLVYLLKHFLPVVSKPHLTEQIEKVRYPWLVYMSVKVYNFIRDALNYGVSVAMQVTSDIIRQHFMSLPPIPKELMLKKYFPEIPYEADKEFEPQKVTYSFLERCLELVQNLGFKQFVLIIDKIDEDSRFSNDADLIADFIEPVLTDNKLLLNPKIQLLISIWNIPFSILIDKVRSQKHFSATLNWETSDLKEALNKRIRVFSNEKVQKFELLFSDDVLSNHFNDIFYLANGNPRDLWHIFKHLFYAQHKIDPLSTSISSGAVKEGLKNFVESFNYFEYYPRKANAAPQSLNIYSYIQHLLRLGKKEFTRNAFKEATGVSGGSVSNYVSQMQKMGLIVNIDREGTSLVYEVNDPKVTYAIDNGYSIIRSN
ncbi:hypothetical protein GTO91_10270 [Heliobacterium undosum]|uniref:Uncharacterized protein n=1 Tax=Heliomicrobium undosum TaxID=121734 RepID=A0A845LAZ2_9FIRM|nr:hypothetical protein [Heliomicrobium undosum]MZP30091.1 hypothetical protein [Heliomicrobium undosum]